MTDLARRRVEQSAKEAAGALEYQASISENGGSQSNANKFKDRAYAIRTLIVENDRLRAGIQEYIDWWEQADPDRDDQRARDQIEILSALLARKETTSS